MQTLRARRASPGKTLFNFCSGFVALSVITCVPAGAQPYGEPDRGEPGDAMIQEYLRQATIQIEGGFLSGIKTADEWNQSRPLFRQQYFHMLGLWPLPAKTPLQATVTHTLARGDYLVDMLHYQSRPGLYVTGNLYRPAKIKPGDKLPAIFYVCGHSPRPRNGNKTAYQSQGIWFARHGYLCLVVDTLEMGELTCTHHGTYREGRWWWLSRGYTPAGVECWNGIRGIDYLISRPDVDPERIGVSGISGGGAATTWISAADERVKVSVPVSGFSDLAAQVPNRVVNGHCDCMFNYNTYQWPYAMVLGMVAPRPLLFVNSDADNIFPMDANERIINRLERLYSLFGAGDIVDSVVSVGGHAYRKDIRQAAFRFMNIHLKNDPAIVTDSEVDLVTGDAKENHPIPPEQLRVFPQDSDFPKDARNARIDYEFVPTADRVLPQPGQFETWKRERMAALKEYTFHHFPETIPAAAAVETNLSGVIWLGTEPGIRIRSLRVAPGSGENRAWLFVSGADLQDPLPAWFAGARAGAEAVYICEPRGVGETRWTKKNPPNYVERSLYLLGRTADSGRVWDIAASAKYVRTQLPPGCELMLAGEGSNAVLAAYAALLSPEVSGLVLANVPATHMDSSAPVLLNVLRVCDIPDALGMLAPRPLKLINATSKLIESTAAIYNVVGAREKLANAN